MSGKLLQVDILQKKKQLNHCRPLPPPKKKKADMMDWQVWMSMYKSI